MRFEGRVALVTCAASGIGKATAELFAREGARVAIGDVADLSETRDALSDIGAEVLGLAAPPRG